MRKVARLVIAFGAAAVMIGCGIAWYMSHEALPPEIRIAAGQSGGLYHTLAGQLANRLEQRTGRPVRVIESAGTEANVGLLRDGGAELALIQTVSSTPEGVVGVAPLYPEILHFIVRTNSNNPIRSLRDLKEKRVALGLKGSSMRQIAHTVLSHYDVQKVDDRGEYFRALENDSNIVAALATTGWMNPTVETLLHSGQFELIGIDDPEGLAMRQPWFTATTIPRGLYPGNPPVPHEPVRTVSVMALLACGSNASDRLVRETLAALYETDLRSSFPAVLSAKAARDYDAALMHPSVTMYHNPTAALNRLSQALELISKSKEAVFGVIAFGILIWSWVRRRRERIAAAADQAQKQKLDDFIARTLTVELEQMEVTDPEKLRPFLRRVTQIKQEALRELTSEKVRGDQLFAIFLSQCAALSEKIQMRMVYGRMSEAADPSWSGSPRTA
jgi:TRAP transporter TAXI family solute receptor